MWEYDEWHCWQCGYVLKLTINMGYDDTWCQACHEPMVKVKEVRHMNT